MNLSSLINLLFLLSCLIILTESRVHEIATFGDQIASLPCEVDVKNCGSIEMISWFKNVSNDWELVYSYTKGGHEKVLGHLIKQADKVSMDHSNMSTTGITYLRIKNLILSDEGSYKCDVTYSDNNKNCPTLTYSKLFTLGSKDHLRPPRITEHPSDTIVGRGEPTKLDCRAEGNPNPTIEWYKDGKPINGAHHNRLALPTGSLFFLHVIHNKKDPDTGTYWCVARNEIGKVQSRNATLNYAFLREEFKTVPKSQAIVSGDKVTLDCVPPRGYPEPKVYWAKDGRPISLPTNRIKLVPGGSLRINDVRPNDAGRYTCIAENTIGTKESPPAILEVSVKPYFIRNPENVSALSGETIEFSCKVGGEPAPYITWTKKDGKIAIGRIQIKEDKTLRIREVKPSDSGVYICEAVNQGGHISSSASLSVDCIPSDFLIQNVADKVPTHSPENLRLAVLNETSANLTWSPLPVDQWKGEPRAYFIRLMSTDHRFCSHFNTSPYQTDLILNNLIYGETYEISVAALTSSGIGSLTEPIPLHMVTSYSYNWQTGSPSSSSTVSELLLKDTTSLTSNSLTKDPIFIFSAILALFILSFIILILFARRHINWNKGMGAYITVQLNNKCDDLVDTKYTKGNGPLTGPGTGGISASSIGNPGYWLTDKKLSTFTASSSSSSPPKGASKTQSQSKYHHQANSGPPVPVGQDYQTAHSESIESGTCENGNEPSKRHLTGSFNGVPSGEVESELDEVEDCLESDYAEVDDRSLKTFGKRLYSSPSTEPYATTTLMKSFRGSTENTSLLGCPNSSQPNGKSMHSLASSRPVKGNVAGKKLNLSAVSLNSNHYPPHHHRLSTVNGKGNKPLTNEGKLSSTHQQQSAQYHHNQHQHLRTNQSNSFHHSSHLLHSSSSSSSTSSSNQNITLINCQNSETQQTPGKSLLTNYSNGNHLNYHSHHNQHQSRSSSLSTSDLIINSANANSRSSPSASASPSSSSSNCSSTINSNTVGINTRDNSNLVPSNVTVHCQYHPIVLASSGSYFEKYL